MSGSTLAYLLSRGGISKDVVVFERKPIAGSSIKCGCGFSQGCFKNTNIKLKKEWRDNPLDTIVFVTPSLDNYQMGGEAKGYIIQKGKMIFDLLRSAGSKGVRLNLGTAVKTIHGMKNGGFRLTTKEEEYYLDALIDCSGINSPVRSHIGLKKIPTLGGIRYTYGYSDIDLTSLRIEQGTDEKGTKQLSAAFFLMDNNIFSGGYGWIFPLGRGLQVGAVCRGNPSKALQGYMALHGCRLPPPREVVGARIPNQGGESKLAYGNIILIGEAGALVNPMNFAGNYPGMACASEVAENILNVYRGNPKPEIGRWDKCFRDSEKKILSLPFTSDLLKEGAMSLYSLSNRTLNLFGKSQHRDSDGKPGAGVSSRRVVLKVLASPMSWKDIFRLRRFKRSLPLLWKGSY